MDNKITDAAAVTIPLVPDDEKKREEPNSAEIGLDIGLESEETVNTKSASSSEVSPPPAVEEKKGDSLATASGPGGPRDPGQPKVQLTTFQFVGVFIGLSLAVFLYALDQTIVSTALNAIVTDLGGVEYVSWIGTALLVTGAAVSPLYGKFSDIFGRRAVFLTAVVIFEIGSLICGLANSAVVLIVGRAIQGIGGGGIFSLVLIIIADLVSFEDRGKYQGIIGACFGVSTVVGPILGGVFTDNLTWRWCFFINLPIGAITVLTVLFLLRFPPPEGSILEKAKKIDYLGSTLVAAGAVLLVTPLQLGGSQYEWASGEIIGMFVASGVAFIGFFFVERYYAREPVVPGSVFMNVSVYASFVFAFCLGGSFFAASYYVPLYFQLIFGHSATDSGLDGLPMIAGVVFFSIMSGQVISRYLHGNFKIFLYIFPVFLTVGLGVLTLLRFGIPAEQIYGFQVLAGVGLGGLVQTRVLAIQASVDVPKIAVATSLSNFFFALGGAVSLAISGSLFNNELRGKLLSENIPENLVELAVSYPQAVLEQAPPQFLSLIQSSYGSAIGVAIATGVPFAIIIFFSGLLIRSYTPQALATEEERVPINPQGDEEKGKE